MLICKKCDTKNTDESKFCKECGHPVFVSNIYILKKWSIFILSLLGLFFIFTVVVTYSINDSKIENKIAEKADIKNTMTTTSSRITPPQITNEPVFIASDIIDQYTPEERTIKIKGSYINNNIGIAIRFANMISDIDNMKNKSSLLTVGIIVTNKSNTPFIIHGQNFKLIDDKNNRYPSNDQGVITMIDLQTDAFYQSLPPNRTAVRGISFTVPSNSKKYYLEIEDKLNNKSIILPVTVQEA